MTDTRPVFLIDARDRIKDAYKTRRREFDRIVATCDYDYDRAWPIFAEQVCPELPRTYNQDVVDLVRTVLWAEDRVARAGRRDKMAREVQGVRA